MRAIWLSSVLAVTCAFLLCCDAVLAQNCQWAKATTGGSEGIATTTDKQSNVYIVGTSLLDSSTNVSFGSVGLSHFGRQAILVAKYDATGNVLWATGTQNGIGFPLGITTDDSNNFYLLGMFISPSITLNGIVLANPGAGNVIFLAKYSPSGSILWAKNLCYPSYNANYLHNYLGTAGYISISGRFVYITSVFNDSVLHISGQTFINHDTTTLTSDMFISRLDLDGNILWTKSFGGISDDAPYGLAATPSGHVYTGGVFVSPVLHVGAGVLTDATVAGSIGYYNNFLIRLDSLGNVSWAASAGGAQLLSGGLAAAGEDVYITGNYIDSSLVFGTYIVTGDTDNPSIYLARYDSSGNALWAKGFAGSDLTVYAITTDPCSNVWISGAWPYGTIAFFVNANFDGHMINDIAGPDPMFLAGFHADGSYDTVFSLPSGGDDISGIATDTSGNLLVCGDYIFNSDGPVIIGPDTFSSASGAENIFIAKYRIAPVLDTLISDSSLCVVDSMSLLAPAGYNDYRWSDGDISRENVIRNSGTYWVYCSARCSLNVVIDTFHIQATTVSPNFSLGPDTLSCAPVLLQVPVPGASCVWQDGSTTPTYTATRTGTYYVAINVQGCAYADTIQVTIPDLKQQFRDTAWCYGQPWGYTLQANVPVGANVLWSDGSTLPDVSVTDTGRYWVSITSGPCMVSDTISITMKVCNCNVFLPTAFTPNGDGQNDTYHPLIENGCNVSNYHFYVFNRWGEVVFSSSNITDRWDGRLNGAQAEMGTYMYVLEYDSGLSGTKYNFKGDFQLIR